uniref:Uncharacterized protein n=1 Tax=viral metagenome TaxID=1070528 RepID=A0A6C0DJK6_9ZZZZ
MTFGSIIGSAIIVALIAYIVLHFLKGSSYSSYSAPRMSGGSAMLPCLANNHCPMGQNCSDGFCSEGFMSSVASSNDMSSCSSKECKSGVNATCSRKETPCPEGTFCQNDACVNITAQDNGEAYKQIGMLLD